MLDLNMIQQRKKYKNITLIKVIQCCFRGHSELESIIINFA